MSITITAAWTDGNLKRFGNQLVQLHQEFPKVLPRIVNQVGERSKTQVIRALTKQTGLKRKTIVAAIGSPKRAYAGSLTYTMETEGGDIRIMFLGPRETRAGVTAAPWGKRRLYPGSFSKGGIFPKRVPLKVGGVFERVGSVRMPIRGVRSGMFIPKELTTGATAQAFESLGAPLLQQRVEAALTKLIGR